MTSSCWVLGEVDSLFAPVGVAPSFPLDDFPALLKIWCGDFFFPPHLQSTVLGSPLVLGSAPFLQYGKGSWTCYLLANNTLPLFPVASIESWGCALVLEILPFDAILPITSAVRGYSSRLTLCCRGLPLLINLHWPYTLLPLRITLQYRILPHWHLSTLSYQDLLSVCNGMLNCITLVSH